MTAFLCAGGNFRENVQKFFQKTVDKENGNRYNISVSIG